MVNLELIADGITELSKSIHSDNVTKGFYDNPMDDLSKLMLVVSEVSEAAEAIRTGKFAQVDKFLAVVGDESVDVSAETFSNVFLETMKDTHEDEIADAIIRLLDYAGYKKMEIGLHILAKLTYNKSRPYMHGKKM